MESAVDRFQRILDENNLTVVLQDPQIRNIKNGGIIIEAALLSVTFTDPEKEVKDESAKPTTEAISGETVTPAQN